jgi:hypothetical protein
VVETKLWRNPEAHRSVVAQIIDYAKDLSKMSFEDFCESATKTKSTDSIKAFFRKIKEKYPKINEIKLQQIFKIPSRMDVFSSLLLETKYSLK